MVCDILIRINRKLIKTNNTNSLKSINLYGVSGFIFCGKRIRFRFQDENGYSKGIGSNNF